VLITNLPIHSQSGHATERGSAFHPPPKLQHGWATRSSSCLQRRGDGLASAQGIAAVCESSSGIGESSRVAAMRLLAVLTARLAAFFVAACAGSEDSPDAGAAASAAAPRASRRNARPTNVLGRFYHHLHRRRRWKRRHRDLVVGGGPTGGNKYQFLAIVGWPTMSYGEPTGDPRVRAWMCDRSLRLVRFLLTDPTIRLQFRPSSSSLVTKSWSAATALWLRTACF
jgi:hypothetical protein